MSRGGSANVDAIVLSLRTIEILLFQIKFQCLHDEKAFYLRVLEQQERWVPVLGRWRLKSLL